MLRRSLPLLAAAALLVSGCGSGAPPEVTFTAGDASATARPTQYCELDLTDCRDDAAAPVELAVPAGVPVRVEVPDAVAEAPWLVVFRYRSADGEQVDERTGIFPPGAENGYTLELPAPGDRLLTAQVQQFGPAPQADPATGAIDFPTRASWVLVASA